MKFDAFKQVTPKAKEPDPPVMEGEVLEPNEAFEALSGPLSASGEKTVFRRCVQCRSISVTPHCARCSNHPIMLPMDFLKMGQQMSTVGRACSYFATGTCIEHTHDHAKWCKDCTKFWDLEFYSPSAGIQFPIGINTALLPRLTKQTVTLPRPEIRQLQGRPEIADKDAEEADQEEWEDELEDSQDNLDRACSLLLNIKEVLDLLGNKHLSPEIDTSTRNECNNFSTAICEILAKSGFDGWAVEVDEEEEPNTPQLRDPNMEFDAHDKEFLEAALRNEERPRRFDSSGAIPPMFD